MMTIAQFRAEMRAGRYAWPGGYPRFFVTADGGVLSFGAARECRREILSALGRGDSRSEWTVVAVDINYEDQGLTCDHTGERIECAYGDD
jgi:hypothetical protein